MIHLKITDKQTFEKVHDVDLTGLVSRSAPQPNGVINHIFWGTIEIETDTLKRTITGEHGQYDYEDEFGFILVNETQQKERSK